MKLPDDFDIDSLPVIGEGAAQTQQAQAAPSDPPTSSDPITQTATQTDPQPQPQAADFDLDSLPEIRRFRMADGEDIDVDERAIARLRKGQIRNPFAPIGTDREAERASVSRKAWKEAGLPEKYGRSQKDRDEVSRLILDAYDNETKAEEAARAARQNGTMAQLDATRPAFEAQFQRMQQTQREFDYQDALAKAEAARPDLGVFGHAYLNAVASAGRDVGAGELIARQLPVLGAFIDADDAMVNNNFRRFMNGEFKDSLAMGNAARNMGVPEDVIADVQRRSWSGERTAAGFPIVDQKKAAEEWRKVIEPMYMAREAAKGRAVETLQEAAPLTATQEILSGAMTLPKMVVDLTPLGAGVTAIPKMAAQAENLVEKGDSEGTALAKSAASVGGEFLIWNKLGKVIDALPGVGNAVKSAGQALARNKVTGNVIARNAGQILEMNAKSGLTELVNDVVGMGRADNEEKKEFSEWFQDFVSVPGNAKKMLMMLPAHLLMKGVGKGKQMLFKEGREAAGAVDAQREIVKATIGEEAARGLSDADVQNIYKIVSSPNLTEKSISDTLSFIEGKAGTENRQGALRELRKQLREGREQAESRDAAREGAEKAYAEQDASIRENAMRQEAARRGITDEKEVKKFGKLYDEYAAEKTVLPFDDWLEDRKAGPRTQNEAAREAKRTAKAEEAADAARAERERLQAEAEQEAAIKERAEEEARPNAAVEEMKAAEAEAQKQEANPHQARLDAWPEYSAWLKKNGMKNKAKNWNKFVAQNDLDPGMKVETPDQAKKRGAKEFERGLAPDEELAAFDEYSKYVQGEEYKSGMSNLSFDEWLAQRRERAKNGPVSAPREEGTTTPPNGAEPPQGAETGENRDTPRPLPPPNTAQAVKEHQPEPKKPFGKGDPSHGQGKYSRKNYDSDAANTGATGAATWHWQNGERVYSLPVDLSQTRPGGPVVLDKTDSAYERINELLNGRQLVMTKSGKIQFKGEFKGAVPKELRELLGRELKIGKNPDAPSKDDLYSVNKGQFGEETRTTWDEVEKAVAADRENYHNWQKRQQRADRRASEEKKLEKKVKSGKATQNELDILRHRNMMEDYLEEGGKETDADYKAMERDLEVLQESGTYDYEGLSKAKDAADKFRDAEWENAIGDIESGEGDFSPSDQYVKPFTRENLQGAKKGDIIHFDHDEVKYELDRYDPETGVMDVYRSDENGVKRRFKVSRNGVEEIRNDGKGQKGVVQDNAGDAGGGGRPAPGAAGGEARGAEGAAGRGSGTDGAETRKPADLTLESLTPEQQRAEQERIARQQQTAAQKAEMEERRTATLKGGTGYLGQQTLDLGGAEGEQDLFNRREARQEEALSRRLQDQKFKDWAKKHGVTPTKDHLEMYDREQAKGAFAVAKRWIRGIKAKFESRPPTDADLGANDRAMFVGIVGGENARDVEAMRGFNVASRILAKKPWAQMSVDEKLKFRAATGYTVGADGSLKREVANPRMSKMFTEHLKEFQTRLSAIRKLSVELGFSESPLGPLSVDALKGIRKVYEQTLTNKEYSERIHKSAAEKIEKIDKLIAETDSLDALDVSYNGRLVDVIEGEGAELLKKYYPDISKIRFRIEESEKPGLMGWFDDAKGEVVFTSDGLRRGIEDIANTLIHETQHFVQRQEGWAPGGNEASGTFKFLKDSAAESIVKNANEALKHLERIKIVADRRRARLFHRNDNRVLARGREAFLGSFDLAQAKRAIRLLKEDGFDIGGVETYNEMASTIERLKNFSKNAQAVREYMRVNADKISGDGFEDYKRLIGEVEARNAARRNGESSLPEETEDRPRDKQIDIRGFNELNDNNVRYFRNVRGDIIGKWDKASGEVTFYPGANAETVAHEIGWHATYDHAERLAAQGDRRLLDKLNAYARGAQQATWTKTLTRYGMASDPRMIIDEVGAARFTAEQAMKIKNEVDRRAALKWYGKAWEACRDAYKSMLTKMGFNKTGIDALNGMSAENAVEFMAKAMAEGKNFAKIKDSKIPGVNDAETIKEKYVRAAKDQYNILHWVDAFTGGQFHLHREQKLTHGAKQKAFNRAMQVWNRIAEAAKAGGVKMSELDEYMRAKGAADRNLRIRNLNGRENGSGISDADAARTVAEYENGPKGWILEDLSKRLWDLQKEGLVERVSAGLVDAQFANDLMAAEPFHVPRHNRFDANGEFTGYETNAELAAQEWHKAEGRTTDAGNALGWIMQEYCDAFSRGAENRVRQRLAMAVLANPELGRAINITPANEAAYAEKTKHNASGNQQVVIVKQGGRKVALELNGVRGERVARAMTGRGAKELKPWVKKALRIWASTATEWSPTFALRNITADLADVLALNIGDHGLVKGLGRDRSHIANMARLAKDIWHYARNGESSNPWIKRFIDAGGLIGGMGREGFTDANEVAAYFGDKITLGDESKMKKFARSAKNGSKLVVKSLFGWVERINKTTEMMNRLADFKTCVERGMSDRDAAAHARDITVDFNEKGEMTGISNALYMFSNSTMGAAFRQVKSLSKHPVQLATSMLAFGFAEGLAECLMNGDEEEREKAGEGTGKDVNEYTRANSIYFRVGDTVVRTPFHAGPLSVIKYTGNCAARWMAGKFNVGNLGDRNSSKMSGADAAAKVGKEAAGILTQFVGLGDAGPTVLQTIVPTMGQWLVQLAQNTDYAGRPIVKPKYTESMPRSQNGRRSTAGGYKWIAEALNEWSGGNAGSKGGVDYEPEVYKTVTEAVGKNVLRDITSSAQTVGYILDMFHGTAEWDSRNVPVVRDFVRKTNGNTQRYYEAANQYRDKRYELQTMLPSWTPEETREFVAKHPWAASPKINKVISHIAELQKMEDGFVKSGKNGHWTERKVPLTDEQKKSIHARRLRLQARFLELQRQYGGED